MLLANQLSDDQKYKALTDLGCLQMFLSSKISKETSEDDFRLRASECFHGSLIADQIMGVIVHIVLYLK